MNIQYEDANKAAGLRLTLTVDEADLLLTVLDIVRDDDHDHPAIHFADQLHRELGQHFKAAGWPAYVFMNEAG